MAFLVLHGEFGEDGQVQTILESFSIPYTGSNARSSRISFSKSATKARLLLAGITTPDSVVIHQAETEELLTRKAQTLGFPLVVKPDAQGSSLGVSVVFEESELSSALDRCFELAPFGLLETYIPGSEWTVGLWNETPLPPICIETPHGFYDYAAKYTDEKTQYHFEADVPGLTLERLKQIAVQVGKTLGTTGIARVDFRLDQNLAPWVLEVNTIPGMTDHSLIPKAAAKIGFPFPELCEQLVLETREKHLTQRAA